MVDSSKGAQYTKNLAIIAFTNPVAFFYSTWKFMLFKIDPAIRSAKMEIWLIALVKKWVPLVISPRANNHSDGFPSLLMVKLASKST